jgi:hypothetical protein
MADSFVVVSAGVGREIGSLADNRNIASTETSAAGDRRRRASGFLPRTGAERTGDDNAYFGTEPLFRRAGFRVVRNPLKDRPRNWIPRVAMRIKAPH